VMRSRIIDRWLARGSCHQTQYQ